MTHDEPIDSSTAGSDPAGIGDEHLVDAILRGRAEDAPERMEARISAAMARIAETPRDAPPPEPRRFRFSPIPLAQAIAATVLFAGLISALLVVSSSPSAEASLLQQAFERMELEDLTYSISVATTENPSSDSFPKAGSKQEPRPSGDTARSRSGPHPGSRAFAWKHDQSETRRRGFEHRRLTKMDGATLHTRGDLWTVLVPTRNDEVFARGFDGESAWTNHQSEQDLPRRLEGDVDRRRQLPFLFQFAMLDLPEMINKIDRHYDISEAERIVSEIDGSSLVRYEATKKTRTSDRRTRGRTMPSSVEIWADPDSARIVFLRLSGLPIVLDGTTAEIEMALESTNGLEDDVFSADRYPRIERRPRKAQPSATDGEAGASSRIRRPGRFLRQDDPPTGE